jgi:hypothetical protein
MSPQTYQLVMRSGPTPGKAFPLDKDEIYIGRDVSNDLVINDAEVSRRHARLTAQSGSYSLEDLGSTNGTFVNGQRVTRPHLLRPGEMVLFGENVSLAYEIDQYDPDATMIGAGPMAAPPPAREVPPPVRETYIPPSPPPPAVEEPVYSGRIPPSPYDEPLVPEEARPRRTWLWAGCGCAALLTCIVLLAILWYIDANLLWCDLFPFIPGCPTL